MILKIDNICFEYPGRPVLEQISFSLEKGQVLAVLGTNGTGKTTLLKCINRILNPSAGSVLIAGQLVDSLSRNELAQKVGYVEQQRSGSRATVFNTVLLGRKPYIRWDITQEDMEIASQALETLGMEGVRPALSGRTQWGRIAKGHHCPCPGNSSPKSC